MDETPGTDAGKTSSPLASAENNGFQRHQRVGEVAKRSNAADCKSVALAASKVRVLPSPPTSARGKRRASFSWQANGGRCGKPASEVGGWKDRGGLARRSAKRNAREREGGSNSVVESQPSKLLVAGSIPVSRSSLRSLRELRRVSYHAQPNSATADLSAEAPTCPPKRAARRWKARRPM